MNNHVVEFLRTITHFRSVPVSQLEWLVNQSQICTYQPGEQLSVPGSDMDRLFIFLRVKLKLKLKQEINYVNLGYFKKLIYPVNYRFPECNHR